MGLAELKSLTRLSSLDLAFCPRVINAGLAELRGLTGLPDSVGPEVLLVTDAGVADLKRLTARCPASTGRTFNWCVGPVQSRHCCWHECTAGLLWRIACQHPLIKIKSRAARKRSIT